jgi:hypothetical protein
MVSKLESIKSVGSRTYINVSRGGTGNINTFTIYLYSGSILSTSLFTLRLALLCRMCRRYPTTPNYYAFKFLPLQITVFLKGYKLAARSPYYY